MLHHFLSVPGPPACERAAPPAAGWWWRLAPSGCGSVSPRCPAAAAGRSSRRRTPAPAPEPSHAPAPPDSDTHTDTAMRRQRDSEGGRERGDGWSDVFLRWWSPRCWPGRSAASPGLSPSPWAAAEDDESPPLSPPRSGTSRPQLAAGRTEKCQ